MCEFEKLTEDDFNSRAHVERDDLRGIECSECGDFNSRAHVERDYIFLMMILRSCYFNSRAHVERDVKTQNHISRLKISTHALTWSATNYSA